MKTKIKMPANLRAFSKIALLLSVLLTAGSAYADSLPVNVVVDVTPEGQAATRPTPATPVYYFPFTVGYQEQGGGWTPESMPSTLEIQRMIAKALAAQGYLVMNSKQAGLLLTFRWGRMAPFADDGNLADPEVDMATLVGGFKQGTDISALGTRHADFEFAASVPRYFVTIEAYDFSAAKEKNKVPLWSARFSTQAAGTTLERALPMLIAAGAPYLGQDVRPRKIIAQ